MTEVSEGFQIIVDASSLCVGARGSVTGVICFKFGDNSAFPECSWNDFPVTILTWWWNEFSEIGRGGRTIRFEFMDGDAAMMLTEAGSSNLRYECHLNDKVTRSGFIDRELVRRALVNAASTIQAHFTAPAERSNLSAETLLLLKDISIVAQAK